MAAQSHSASDLDQVLLPNSRALVPSRSLQAKIIETFWPSDPNVTISPKGVQLKAYFIYFQKECEAWRVSGSPVALHTYSDLLALVQHLRRTRTDRRNSRPVQGFFERLSTQRIGAIRTASSSSPYDSTSIKNAIILSIRLWLMLEVGSDGNTLRPGSSRLVWADCESLNDFLQRCFGAQGPQHHAEACSTVPAPLNAYSLKYVAGFDIVWTDHLADHLYLNEDTGTISMYHHASLIEVASQENRIGWVTSLVSRNVLRHQ